MKTMNSKNYTFTYDSKPTDENIYYMFQRLTIPIIIATTYEPYKKYWNDYERLLNIVRKWISIYYNTTDLTKVNDDSLEEFDSLITDLKFSCLEINTLYIEEIDIWHGEFLHLLNESINIKKKGENLCQENQK